MDFPSPSGKSAVEMWQTRIDNSFHMRADLVSGARRVALYTSPNDAVVTFVHVYWSPDEAKVGILASGVGIWDLAFDTRTGAAVPFDQIRDSLFNSIRQTYRLSKDEELLRWSSSREGAVACFRRHPEIHVDYWDRNSNP